MRAYWFERFKYNPLISIWHGVGESLCIYWFIFIFLEHLMQELPTCLPSSYKGRMKMERKVVYLRDSAMRMWPVLYHERPNFKILTSGWKDFSKANLIQPGDECVFSLENDLEAIYGVHIARRWRKLELVQASHCINSPLCSFCEEL